MSTDSAEAVRPLDFSQPTKFTTEIRRRIAAGLERFCEAATGLLESELGTEVELSVGQVDQHTWAAAKAKLPADAVAVAVQAQSIERQMLLSVEQPLLLQMVECLLGGQAAGAPAERHLTDLDWMLARGLLAGLVSELSGVWGELGGPSLSCGEIDLEADAGVSMPASEPTFSIALVSTVEGHQAALSLLVPWSAIEPVADRIRGGEGAGEDGDLRDPDALRRGLVKARVLLRSEVGSAQMPIERMLELVPGALVHLQGRAEQGVSLFAEGVLLGRGRPGRAGVRRAVKLESISEVPTRAHTYAKLGRPELERARANAEEGEANGEGHGLLRSIFVRVWAELGRTHLPLGEALELTPGAVVELDQPADAPIELFANGRCFARGELVVTGDGAWGVQVQTLVQ